MKRSYVVLFFFSVFFSCTNAPGSNTKTVTKKTFNTAVGITKFDINITGFKIATILDDTKIIFTAHGKDDAQNLEPTTGFFIQGFLGMDNLAAKKNMQEFAYNREHNENVSSTENEIIKIYNTPIGKAIFITVTIKYKNKKTAVATTATISNGKNAILFVGEDYNDGDYSDKFKSTFDSIEF